MALALPLTAAAQGLRLDDVVQAELLSGWRTGEGTRMAALKVTLAPGWKTYWRAPGDAGIPPNFQWTGSRNMASVATHWPRPTVFSTSGFQTVGYEGEVILPLEFAPKDGGAPIEITASVQLGICEDICIPVTLELNGHLDGAGASDPMIHAALADQPVAGKKAGVRKATCALDPISDGLRLTAEIEMPKVGRSEVVVVEAGDARIWVSEAAVHRSGRTLTVTADLVPPRGQPAIVDRSDLRFTVLGERQAVDVRGCQAG